MITIKFEFIATIMVHTVKRRISPKLYDIQAKDVSADLKRH